MRGEVWAEALIVAAGVVLGIFLVTAPLFSHLNAVKTARTAPVLTLAEVLVEQGTMVPYSVYLFEINRGNLLVKAFPSSDRIAKEMNGLGVEVYTR